jgi:hypothetical protein
VVERIVIERTTTEGNYYDPPSRPPSPPASILQIEELNSRPSELNDQRDDPTAPVERRRSPRRERPSSRVGTADSSDEEPGIIPTNPGVIRARRVLTEPIYEPTPRRGILKGTSSDDRYRLGREQDLGPSHLNDNHITPYAGDTLSQAGTPGLISAANSVASDSSMTHTYDVFDSESGRLESVLSPSDKGFVAYSKSY